MRAPIQHKLYLGNLPLFRDAVTTLDRTPGFDAIGRYIDAG
jgi:hypothetical protein